jgi:RNA polymerase sigma-70 factor (sigma-E family)
VVYEDTAVIRADCLRKFGGCRERTIRQRATVIEEGWDATMTGQDDAAFSEYALARWATLYRLSVMLAPDAHAAEDILQEALVKTYRSWRSVTRAEHPDAYVRRIVVNTAIAQSAKASRRKERSDPDPPDELVASGDDLAVEHLRVWSAVSELAPRQRAVIVLRFYADLSETEIADALGCAPGTIKSQSHAAIANLRRSLKPSLDEVDEK